MKIEKKNIQEAKENLGYSTSDTYYVGKMQKGKFIAGVAELDGSSKGWVRERFSVTGNKEALKAIEKYGEDKIIALDWRTKKVLKVYDKDLKVIKK